MKSGAIRDIKTGWRTLQRSFDLTGRSGRYEGCAYVLLLMLAGCAMLLCVNIANVIFGWRSIPIDPPTGAPAIQWLMVFPLAAWAVRRTHDIGLSSYYCLPLFASIAARTYGLPQFIDSVLGGLNVILIIMLFVWQPTKGPNRFGLDPRGIDASEQTG